MIYLDTGYLVRLYFGDAGFEMVRRLAGSDHVACAAHGQAEMLAAFHRKFREGVISQKSFRALMAQLEHDDKLGAIRWLPSGSEVLLRLRTVYSSLPLTTFLRGADAVHLATAAVNGFTEVFSNDAHLLAAAGAFGLRGSNILV